MKLNTVAVLLAALATTCSAQIVNIISPPSGTSVFPGQKVELAVQYNKSLADAVSLYTTGYFTKPHWNWFYRALRFLFRFTHTFLRRIALARLNHLDTFSNFNRMSLTLLSTSHPISGSHRRFQTSFRKMSTSLFPMLSIPLSPSRSRSRLAPQSFSSTSSLGIRQW